MEPLVWFITGGSSGFGRAIAEHVLDDGYGAAVTARDKQDLESLQTRFGNRILAEEMNVVRKDQVDAAVDSALLHFGTIDVLVNAAGRGMLAAVEEATEEQIQSLIDVNVLGMVRTIQAVLPHMRGRRAGVIVNFSSVGGFVTVPGFGYYHATKFAIEGLSETLAQEVAPLGISVMLVEPGGFRTNFDSSLAQVDHPIEDYAGTVGKMRTSIQERNGSQPGDPAKAARAIVEAVRSKNRPSRLVLGKDALERMRAKIHTMITQIADWENVSMGTGFDAK